MWAFISCGAVGLLGFMLLLVWYAYPAPKAKPSTASMAIQLPLGSLSAKAAIVYDPATNQILYDKNSQLTLPLASITKLMTAHVVLGSVPSTTLVTITAKDISKDGDAGDWGLKAGDTLRLGDLIKIGLAASSNYAMAAAAGSLGSTYMADMNRDARHLGLTHTYFLNSTGLDITAQTSGAYGSAYDIAILASAFLKEYPQYFELSSQPSVTVRASGHAVTASATSLPLQNIPGFIGAKTGYTDLAGGNLVMAYDIDIGHPLIAVVLGSTEQGRFTDMRTLVDASREMETAQQQP
jgi:D-alanyl-D-alanine carboxypeptidase